MPIRSLVGRKKVWAIPDFDKALSVGAGSEMFSGTSSSVTLGSTSGLSCSACLSDKSFA